MAVLAANNHLPSPSRPRGAFASFLRTPKGQLLVIFAGLFALASAADGFFTLLPHVTAATLVACLVDLPYLKHETGGWRMPTSALLTGLIVAFILDPVTPLLVTAATSALAIMGKRAIRTSRGHVFNPAALALLVPAMFLGSGESWWGALVDLPGPFTLLMIAAGLFVADRLNKAPLVLVFTGAYFALWGAVSFVNATAAAEMFRDPFVQSALFLALFMLTDPPTSPNRVGEQVGFGVIAAVTAVAAQLLGAGQLFLLVGVLVANLWLFVRRLRVRASAAVRPRLPADETTPIATPVQAELGASVVRSSVHARQARAYRPAAVPERDWRRR